MDNKLTPEEIETIRSMYYGCQMHEDKMILTPLLCISDDHLLKLCRLVESFPFAGTKPNEWYINRGTDKIKIAHVKKQESYHLHLDDGSLYVYNNSKPSVMGNTISAAVFYMRSFIAFPLFWAQFKDPFRLELALPCSKPLKELLKIKCDNDKELMDLWYFEKVMLNYDLNNIDNYTQAYKELLESPPIINSK